MNKVVGFGVLTVAMLLIGLPGNASAYTVQSETAERLSDTLAVYTLTFAIGTNKNDFFIPTMAVSEQSGLVDGDNLIYEVVRDRDHVATDVLSAASIYSSADRVGDFYRVPAGRSATFTLVALVATAPELSDAEYLIRVVDLPHYVGRERAKRAVSNPLLRTYITSGIELNTAWRDRR